MKEWIRELAEELKKKVSEETIEQFARVLVDLVNYIMSKSLSYLQTLMTSIQSGTRLPDPKGYNWTFVIEGDTVKVYVDDMLLLGKIRCKSEEEALAVIQALDKFFSKYVEEQRSFWESKVKEFIDTLKEYEKKIDKLFEGSDLKEFGEFMKAVFRVAREFMEESLDEGR